MRLWPLLLLLLLCCTDTRRSSDPGFILLENHLSPDGRLRLLVYHYDTGAFGYSRAFWAVTPAAYEGLNLARYELPDGYMGLGWSAHNELLVQEWRPYYSVEDDRRLRPGQRFHGAVVKLTPPGTSHAPARTK